MSSTGGSALTGIECRTEQLESYSGLHTATACVCFPTDLDELRRIFAYAKAKFAEDNAFSVTLRSGAHAFDSQSLGDQLVVSMTRFDKITVLKNKKQVCVEPGATWGSILAELSPHGLVPASTVTSSHATAGGTLAADCLSRFSPLYGKESSWVERFSLLTINGDLLECTRPAAGVPKTAWTDKERVFMAAIGGFGYLGAFVDITYNVLSPDLPKIRALTRVVTHTTFKGLADELVPAMGTMSGSPLHRDKPQWDAISAGLYPAGGDTPSSMVFFSKFTGSRRRHPLSLYQPKNPLRIGAEFVMRNPLLCKWLSWVYFRLTSNDATYVNDLDDFMFFMDANTTARRIARFLHKDMRMVQQTFVVPAALDHDDPMHARDQLSDWLKTAHDFFSARELTPTLQDVLFLPGDLSFCLSPNAGLEGFAVSYAFETSNDATLEAVKVAFSDLADVLWNKFKGHVSLVKNVQIKPATLEKMYCDGADEFFLLKARLDPHCLLRNEFLKRLFPARMSPAGPPGASGAPGPPGPSGRRGPLVRQARRPRTLRVAGTGRSRHPPAGL
jgi:decaprenylphospho-beta-D-ribofuranose 2-oxidase